MAKTKTKIKIAISTCPNDTFAFHGLLTGAVLSDEIEFEFQLLDIQQLNDGLMDGKFDVAKASFHAAVLLAEDTVVLPSGSALGFGVGPLLLAAQPDSQPQHPTQRTLCPGALTTATMLFRLFYPETTAIEQTLFSEIMPNLQKGSADFGVCIHEGRFTWEEQGLHLIKDLGTRWEQETASPLPLGGILARRSLGQEMLRDIQDTIRASIEYGLANRDETLSTMKKYAQELDDEVVFSHVDLYVNDWTIDLGEQGQTALKILSQRARESGLVPNDSRDIEVFCSAAR